MYMFNVSLSDVYGSFCAIRASSDTQKIECQDYIKNIVTKVANSVFEVIGPYSFHGTASIAGILAAKGLDGLTNPKANKYPWINLALSMIAGGFVYNGNKENFSLFSQIFLASAFATAVCLGKHSAVNCNHFVMQLDREQQNASTKNCTTIVNGVKKRPMTKEEKGYFDRSMNEAFGPGSIFEQAFGKTAY